MDSRKTYFVNLNIPDNKRINIDMDYKEKYEEAYKLYHSEETTKDQKYVLERLFPELAESEDERIRKGLIEYFLHYPDYEITYYGLKSDSVISWLEKLEEVFSGPMDWNDYKDKPVEIWNAYQRGVFEGFDRGKNSVKNNPTDYGLEKQGEQKSVDKPFNIEIPFGAKDSELIEETMTIPEGCYAIIEGNRIIIRKGEKPDKWSENKEFSEAVSEKIRNMVSRFFHGDGNITSKEFSDQFAWELLTLARYEIQREQKPAWSEEDELYIRELESLVKQVWATAERENDKDTIHKMSDLLFFLKTLKPQLKQEWSEEDEYMINFISERLFSLGATPLCSEIKWLKSLKDRYTWKPSEFDVKILEQVIDGTVNPINYHATLYAILEQLKKLREE